MATARRLEGKVAIVTGGASGIGLATVERFVEEGASVVFCDFPPGAGKELDRELGAAARLHHHRRTTGGPNDGAEIAQRLGDAASFVPCDVTNATQLGAVFSHTVDRFGGLDVLVNNAGVGGGEGSVEHCSDEIFDRTIAVNLRAVWQGMKLAFPHLRQRAGGGSIVSVASVSGLVAMPGQGAYGASKAGVIQLTRIAAMEGAPHFIRANAVCPGGTVTPIIYDSPFFDAPLDPEVIAKQMESSQPLPRAGRPLDIANAILWLASDESSFVTGQVVVVDGGLSVEFDSRNRPRRNS